MEQKAHILVLTNTFPTNDEPGATPCIEDQIVALREQGYNVELDYIDRQSKINYFKAAWQYFLLTFKKKRYDLIHAHYGHSGVIARMQFKHPVVVTFHGSDILGGWRGAMFSKDGIMGRVVAQMVNGVIVMTDLMKTASRRKDAYVIPFGVNTSIFHPYPLEDARRELGLSLEEKIILFPWNPDRAVKQFWLAEAAVKILKEEMDNIRLLPVYNESRGRIASYMNASDVMILTSNYEGSPMAVREALTCNLPVVSVDVGDVAQIIEGINGCYIAESTPEDIAEKLRLSLSRGQRADGETKLKELDASWAARQVSEVYDQVLGRSNKSQ